MRPGVPLGSLLAAAAALALLALVLAGSAHAEFVSTEIPAVRNEANIQDVYIDSTAPDNNFNEGDGSEFLEVRAPADKASWVFVKFPIEQIPRNATISTASFTFHNEANTGGRTLTVWVVRVPWDEGQINWTTGHNIQLSEDPINNHTTQGFPEGVPETDRNTPEVFQDFGGGGITASVQRMYSGKEPNYGWVIKDTRDTDALGRPVVQRWYSSSSFNNEDFRPFLTVGYDNNAPEFRRILADGQHRINATSTRAVNLSFEVFDPMGSIVDTWINATTPAGFEVFNKSIFQNRSTVLLNVPKHTVWSNESLGLPPGDYVINAWALDNDGNLVTTCWRARTPCWDRGDINITVENDPPFVNNSAISASNLDEGAPFSASLTAEDFTGIASVTLEVRRADEVLANLSLVPVEVDANLSGDYRIDTHAVWAGQLNLTLWVQDTAGNLNHSRVFQLRVRDNSPPVVVDAKVLAPGFGPQGPFQEEGGRVTWEATIRDASPLTVTLEINPPSGGHQVVPMTRIAGTLDQFRYAANFTERGSYAASLLARDPDGNTASRGGLGFVLLDAAAPTIESVQPRDGAWAPARPIVSAIVRDLNLDANSIIMDLRVPPDPFLRAESSTSFESETARRIQVEEPFFHNETVQVRVAARDLLGNGGDRTWSFRVDAAPPVTFLTPVGVFLAGNRTLVTGSTDLRLERSDEGSGVLATVMAVINEDAALRSGNITLPGSAPATLNLSGSPVYRGTGNYTLFLSTVDEAGNVETVQEHRFLVDDSPPEVGVSFEPGLLTARVLERGAGLREVRAKYWISPGGQQGEVPMSPADEAHTLWQARIPDASRGAQVLYAVEAVDLLGNTGRAGSDASPLRSIVQNHLPVVTLAPANGSLVRGVVHITWSITDADGDPLEVSIGVRPSTSDRARELAPRRGATGSLDWDTREAGDGLWEIQVRVRDGFEEEVARSAVEVANTQSRIAGVAVHGAEPGEPVRIEVTLYTPVERATAVVLRDDKEVARIALTDDGVAPDRRARDSVFTGEFRTNDPGNYRVDLDILFQGGRLEDRDHAATAEVQWAFPGRIVHEPLLLALVIGVPAVLVGVWAYRRYGPVRTRR